MLLWIPWLIFRNPNWFWWQSFAQKHTFETGLSFKMPNVSLIFISRVIASASFTLQVLHVVSASHYIGIWPKKTPADAQVSCLIFHPVLPFHCLFISAFFCPRWQKSILLNWFVQHADYALVLTSVQSITVIFRQRFAIPFPYEFCHCEGSHLVNACDLFVLINHSFWFNFTHIAYTYWTFILYNLLKPGYQD